MFPACSLLFSRPGRITSTFRPSLSVPATYCFPVAPSAATSRHRMRSGRVLARHRAVAENIFSAFFRFQARARRYRHRHASLAKRLRSLVPRSAGSSRAAFCTSARNSRRRCSSAGVSLE